MQNLPEHTESPCPVSSVEVEEFQFRNWDNSILLIPGAFDLKSDGTKFCKCNFNETGLFSSSHWFYIQKKYHSSSKNLKSNMSLLTFAWKKKKKLKQWLEHSMQAHPSQTLFTALSPQSHPSTRSASLHLSPSPSCPSLWSVLRLEQSNFGCPCSLPLFPPLLIWSGHQRPRRWTQSSKLEPFYYRRWCGGGEGTLCVRMCVCVCVSVTQVNAFV